MANPNQPKGIGGMFVRKEQRPDPVTSGSAPAAPRGLDDPDYHYRTLGRDKLTEEFDQVGLHKDLGYQLVRETAQRAVYACPKDQFEARVKARQQKSIDALKPYKKSSSDYVEQSKGGLPSE